MRLNSFERKYLYSFQKEENKLQNVRVYRKRQQKDSKIQLSNRESKKYQTATVNVR
jgi:hypothetical protein